MVEEKQEGGVFYPPPPGKIGLKRLGENEKKQTITISLATGYYDNEIIIDPINQAIKTLPVFSPLKIRVSAWRGACMYSTLKFLSLVTFQLLQNKRGRWFRAPGVLRFAVIRGRVDFQGRLLTQKSFRQGANLGFNKCWVKKYFRPGRKLDFGHELFKNSFEQSDFFSFISKYSLNMA